MKTKFETILKNDKAHFSKCMYLFIIGVIIGFISYVEIQMEQVRIAGYMLSTLLIFMGYLSLNDYTKIKLIGNDLIVEKRLFGKVLAKSYDLKKIDNLKYVQNVKSNFYTSSGNIKVMGVDMTPESMKNYYYHKEIISFDFDNKLVELGKWKKAFNAKKLYGILHNKIR